MEDFQRWHFKARILLVSRQKVRDEDTDPRHRHCGRTCAHSPNLIPTNPYSLFQCEMEKRSTSTVKEDRGAVWGPVDLKR